jgi:hypothetical protein
MPGEAAKILCVTEAGFNNIKKIYRAFHQGLKGRPKKQLPRQRALKRHFLKPKQPARHFSDYEPSNAIYVNECDYRRWARVKEWFNQFGPDVEKNERKFLDQIKMDT